MNYVGETTWFANPTVVTSGENYILVTVRWDYTEDGETDESRMCFAFSMDSSTWERGLWQVIGAVNICKALQVGLDSILDTDEEDAPSGYTVH